MNKRRVFKSVDELVAAIELFVLAHNEAQTNRLDQKRQIHFAKNHARQGKTENSSNRVRHYASAR